MNHDMYDTGLTHSLCRCLISTTNNKYVRLYLLIILFLESSTFNKWWRQLTHNNWYKYCLRASKDREWTHVLPSNLQWELQFTNFFHIWTSPLKTCKVTISHAEECQWQHRPGIPRYKAHKSYHHQVVKIIACHTKMNLVKFIITSLHHTN